MKSTVLRSLNIALCAICVFISSLSASMLPGQIEYLGMEIHDIQYKINLGPLRVFHDESDNWTVIDKNGCAVTVDNNDVPQEIRYVSNDVLRDYLGEGNSYLQITKASNDDYIIRLHARAPGSGIICGTLGPIIVKIGLSCYYNSTVGEEGKIKNEDIFYSCLTTMASGLISAGLDAYLKSAKFAKEAAKISQLFKESDKAAGEVKKAALALNKAMNEAEKYGLGKHKFKYIEKVESAQKLYNACSDKLGWIDKKATLELTELAKKVYEYQEAGDTVGKVAIEGYKHAPEEIKGLVFNTMKELPRPKDVELILDHTLTTALQPSAVNPAKFAVFVENLKSLERNKARNDVQDKIDLIASVVGMIGSIPYLP